METPSLETAPFWGPGSKPEHAIWISFPENSPTGIRGNALFFLLFGQIRFGQKCEEQLFLFGDTVYSAWRVWKLSPTAAATGHISLMPFGRYWWPQLKWKENFDDLPEGTVLNLEHKNSTPDDYNHDDPSYHPELHLRNASTFWSILVLAESSKLLARELRRAHTFL